MASRVLLAAEQGDRKSMQAFITDKEVNIVNEEGCTPLMVAAANGRDEIIRQLLEQECLKSNELDKEDERYIDRQNHYGWTALMQAAINGHLNSVLQLLRHGARVDIQNAWGATALVIASQGGCFGVVHTLINHDANVNEGGTEEVKTLTPLMAAAQSGHLEIVRELLQAGACIDVRLGSTGWTALMLAALNNQVSVVELLLQHGAKGDQSDVNNKKAADLAISLGHQDVLSLLAGEKLKKVTVSEFIDAVKSGNVNRVRDILHRHKSLACAKDKEGATPLMYAANKGHVEMCEVLLKSGAEMNAADDKYGWTALMLAVQHKKYEVVKVLGRWGADFSIRGKSGSTAKDISNRNGDIEMIRLISNMERQQQRNAPPTSAMPTSRSDSTQREQPLFSLKEIQGRIQNAYRLPTPTINVNVPQDGETTPTNPRFNLPGGRVIRGFPSPASSSATPPSSSTRSGGDPLSLASSSSSEQTMSESSTSSAYEQQISRPLFPPGPLSTRPLPSTPDRTGLARPVSGSNLLNQSPAGRGQKGAKVSALLSKSNPGRGGESKSVNLQFKNEGGVRLSSHPLLSPQSNSKFRLPNTPGSPFLQAGGGNSISSRLLEKRGSASSSGGSSTSSSRQTSLEFPSSAGSPAKNANWRKRSNTEPISPFMKGGGGKGPLKIQSFSSGIADLKRALEEASLGHHFRVFRKQEVDLQLFLTMSDKDLAEMGILDSSDRAQLLALISKLVGQQKGAANGSSRGVARPAVFVFQ